MTQLELDNNFSLDEKYQWQKKYYVALRLRRNVAISKLGSYASAKGWNTTWAHVGTRYDAALNKDVELHFVVAIAGDDILDTSQYRNISRNAYVLFGNSTDRCTDNLVPLLVKQHRLSMRLLAAKDVLDRLTEQIVGVKNDTNHVNT